MDGRPCEFSTSTGDEHEGDEQAEGENLLHRQH
jgi:hypothetical protein